VIYPKLVRAQVASSKGYESSKLLGEICPYDGEFDFVANSFLLNKTHFVEK
jgi:hypothetical protein